MADEVLLDQVKSRAALEAVRDELAALPEAAEREVNVSVPASVLTVLRSLPRIHALRADIAELPKRLFDLACFDRLELYALALFQAHVVAEAAQAGTPPARRDELVAEALRRRRELLDDLRPLANRGLVEPTRLAKVQNTTSHDELAVDLALLAEVLRDSWPAIEGRTALGVQDVRSLEQLAQRLMATLDHQPDASAVAAAERDLRRTFALFWRAHHETRRVVTFLRWWEGDANEIAPSIYDHRKRRAAAPPAENVSDVSDTTVSTTVSDSNTPVSDTPVSDTVSDTPVSDTTSAVPASPAAPRKLHPGDPNNPPFES